MSSPKDDAAQETIELHRLLLSPGYFRVLLLSAAIGIPVSLAAFSFLVAVHELQHLLWETWPHTISNGGDVPWWWPLPMLTLCGVLVGLVITRLPGHGGHVPAAGAAVGVTPPGDLFGVLLAAAATLALGGVLGPEAPLIAVGSGLAVLLVSRVASPNQQLALMAIGAAGAAAAIAAIFGNPLVAAVLLLEAGGLAGPRMTALLLPCLLSTAVGALVFTGLGKWSGLSIGALAVPTFDAPDRPDLADLVWTPLIAVAAAGGVRLITGLAHVVLARLQERVLVKTAAIGVAVGACCAAYALLSGRSPAEVAMSGQIPLPELVAEPGVWATSAFILLLMFKGVAYGLSLAAFRGGPIFPAVFLGAAFGALVADLPGLGSGPAIAVGIAAATAASMRLPIAAVLLTTLLLGPPVIPLLPVVLLAVVVAIIGIELSDHVVRRR